MINVIHTWTSAWISSSRQQRNIVQLYAGQIVTFSHIFLSFWLQLQRKFNHFNLFLVITLLDWWNVMIARVEYNFFLWQRKDDHTGDGGCRSIFGRSRQQTVPSLVRASLRLPPRLHFHFSKCFIKIWEFGPSKFYFHLSKILIKLWKFVFHYFTFTFQSF